MKRAVFVTLLLLGEINGFAQTNATETAEQTVQVNLTNTIEIAFTNTNSQVGNTVTLPFSNVNDFANGVESTLQEMYVSSNKHFTVTVHTVSAYFTVTNNGVTTPSTMPSSVLGMMLSNNNTGGTIGQNFSSTSYNSLSQSSSNLITNANNGYLETFAIKYKATPGFVYPAGVYSNDVVFTATQQ
jgi:hypothetical protein